MTKSTITRERVVALIAEHSYDSALVDALEHLLAAMDSEHKRNPVLAYAESYRDMAKQGVESVTIWSVITDLERNIAPLYRHAQPAPERDQVRSAHAEWSQDTFGNVGPVGPLKHLSKEALEAAEQPGDLSEWADMQFLMWDAQRRAGITDEQITQAMIEKLAVNKQRKWPEPKDGEPRLHIKEQPAPVVPVVPEGLNHETTDLVLRFASALADKLYKAEQKYGRSTDWMKDDWYDDCLQSLLEHIKKGDPKDVAAYCAFMWHHGWKTKVAQPAQEEQKSISDRQAIFALESAGAATPIGRAYKMELNACRAAMLAATPQSPGSEPATVPGKWIPVSERMPESNKFVLVSNGVWVGQGLYDDSEHLESDEHWQDEHREFINVLYHPVTHWMPLPAAPQEVKK